MIRAHKIRLNPTPEQETCSVCKETKGLSFFPNNGQGINRADGKKRYTCKACNANRVREWQKRNPKKLKDAQRKYDLKSKYGISPEEYEAIMERQGGTCAVCGGTMPNGNKLAVDHDHISGRVRGLLCVKCNRALGLVDDDPDWLRKLAAYLDSM